MEYDVYHDESMEGGYWHGILLIPTTKREALLATLAYVRSLTGYYDPLTLKGLRSRKNRFECTRLWVESGVVSLMQDHKGKILPPIYYRRKSYSQGEKRLASFFEKLPPAGVIRAKFILYRERDSLKKMGSYSYSDFAAKVETTFRMGLKGGLHYLFDERNPVHISSIHFHGYEHHQRAPSRHRLVERLRDEARDYCNIPENIFIDFRTGDHRQRSCQGYDDCQLLQLTDLMTGAFRTHLHRATSRIQREATDSVKELIGKWNRGPARLRNSRWGGGFCITDSRLEEDGWRFESTIVKEGDATHPKLFHS